MNNKTFLLGNLTRDNVVTQTPSGTTILKNTIAVQRRNKEREADFINFTAFGKTAEFMQKYTGKGSKIMIEGRIQTNSYEKDGIKRFTTDIIVETVELLGQRPTVETTQVTPNVMPNVETRPAYQNGYAQTTNGVAPQPSYSNETNFTLDEIDYSDDLPF